MKKYKVRSNIPSVEAFHVGADPIPEWFSTYNGVSQYIYDRPNHLCEIIFKDTHGMVLTAFPNEDTIYRTSSGIISKIGTDLFKRVFEEETSDDDMSWQRFGNFAGHVAALIQRLDGVNSQESLDDVRLQLFDLANAMSVEVAIGEEDERFTSEIRKKLIKISYFADPNNNHILIDTRHIDLPDNMIYGPDPGPGRYAYEN